MGKINVLDEQVINKIAAGEVVERPASVIKELLDNAIDAGAKNIKIEIWEGGVKKIVVVDDGMGMVKEDLVNAWKSHWTSKLKTVDDLWQIRSLGFRGEALASIAAVSKLMIASKTDEQLHGNVLKIVGGKKISVNKIGMPKGTRITVEDLFFNLPVRKKFLKSIATELRHIVDEVVNHALGYPDLAFELRHNGKLILNYSSSKNVKNRVTQVLGKELAEQLIEIYFDHAHLKIKGWIGKPESAHNVKYKQYWLINNRRISDKGLTAVVKKTFGNLLPPRVYPVFVIYLQMPPDLVDVNVHPRKEEVRFVNSGLVFNSVAKAVSHALENNDLTFGTVDYSNEQKIVDVEKISVDKNFNYLNQSTSNGERSYGNQNFHSVGEKRLSYELNKPIKFIQEPVLEGSENVYQPKKFKFMQVHNLFLIQESEDGLLIVDQHAAHERMLYEKFVHEFKNKIDKSQQQSLLIPIGLDLMPKEKFLMEENLSVFKKIGFELVKNKSGFTVTKIPVLMTGRPISKIITGVLEDLDSGVEVREVDDDNLRILTYLSCRSAVKAGDRLSDLEIQEILDGVAKGSGFYTCPHGRPLKIELSKDHLEKMFKRKGF